MLRAVSYVVLFALTACPTPVEQPDPPNVREETPAPYTPRWAFRPWISKDISNRADTYAFVKGFQYRGIPFGAVVLDSPWASSYNSFVPSSTRYPDFAGMLNDLHAQDIKVVLWTTQMINVESFDVEPGGDSYDGPSPNYGPAKRGGFFVNDGDDNLWWKGRGGAIDFFNDDAVAFWHEQQRGLLEMGLDGWKLDFGENYIEELPIRTARGEVTLQQYSEEYYRDFLAHGVAKSGSQFVTMTRPWDESYQFAGRFFAKPGQASVYWVGDNRRDWIGMSDALDHMFRSAAAGYVAIGSDVGGYMDRDDKQLTTLVPADTEVFIRWTALGALNPFMQLHGRANLTPWTVPDRVDESVSAWRYWATFHDDLVPFWYSLAQEAYAGGPKLMQPVGELASWAGDYRYFLGEAFFVAPLLGPGGARDVQLPAGARYFDWWAPTADPLQGGQTLTGYSGASALPRIPLFVREGAIVPMDVKTDATALGAAGSSAHLTVLAWPSAGGSTFKLWDSDEEITELRAQRVGQLVTASSTRALKPLLFRLWTGVAPASVSVNGAATTSAATLAALTAIGGAGHFYDSATRTVWVRTPADAAASISVQLP